MERGRSVTCHFEIISIRRSAKSVRGKKSTVNGLRSLSSTWQGLPPQYTAGPRVHLGSEVEIDVATFESEPEAGSFAPSAEGAAVATAWAPAKPTLAVETELSDFDEYEVRVYDTRRGRRLVAAIELVSPANKDRPEHRSQFTSKCAALLRQGVSLVLVDVVTVRDNNLYADLLELIGQWDSSLGDRPPATYAVACRWRPRGAALAGKLEPEPDTGLAVAASPAVVDRGLRDPTRPGSELRADVPRPADRLTSARRPARGPARCLTHHGRTVPPCVDWLGRCPVIRQPHLVCEAGTARATGWAGCRD